MLLKFKFVFLITGVFILINSFSAFSQADTAFLGHAVSSLDKYTAANPAEKVYLQLDKTNYNTGDTVWYKAYTVTGAHHQLSAISGVFYVELIGPADTVMSRQVLQLTSGMAWNGLALPDKAKAGDYHIRAYTNWMRNAGTEYFYNQQIHINGDEAASALVKPVTGLPDLQFFPEGGSLVNGLRCKVAVKAVGPNGYGQDIKGVIADETGNVVADFATTHLGMGAFAFTPQTGKSYKASITIGQKALTVPLPAANEMGYSLAINNSSPDSIFIKIAASEQQFKQKQNSKFYITAQSAGKVYYAAAGNLDNMVFTSTVDKKRFPSGIVQFTLFAEDGEPLNERSAFIRNFDTLQLNIGGVEKTQEIRQKVKVALDTKVAGAFSVAVVNESQVADDELSESNILTQLLLTSDLKGYVEQPNYYFTDASEESRADLDLLMLTQGYQRYEWKPILANTLPPARYQPEDALSLNGQVTAGSKPVAKGKVLLIAPQYHLLADTTTDSNGMFRFTGLDLPDSAKVVLSAKKINNNNNVNITITPESYPAVIRSNAPAGGKQTLPDSAIAKTAVAATYKQQKTDLPNKKHQLKEVVVKAHKYVERIAPDLSNSANLNGPGQANQVIMADELKDCLHLADCLTQLLRVSVDFAKTTVIINGNIMSGDGAPTNLNDLDPSVVHSIEVLKHKSYLNRYGEEFADKGRVVLVITTKQAGDKDFFNTEPVPGTLKYAFKGFYKAAEFYSPKYDTPENKATVPDQRSTIYWNPNITTDKDGKASFEYFNADTKGTYRIVVEGIDGEGNLGRGI